MMQRNQNKMKSADRFSDTTNFETEIDLESSVGLEHFDSVPSEMFKQLKPLLVCMRIFGLFFTRTTNHKGKTKTELVFLYCIFVNCLMLVNIGRSFAVYRFGDEFDDVLVQRLLFTIWSAECTFKGLLLLVNCYSQKGLPAFFREWKITCRNVKLDRLCLFMMKKYIFLAFLFIIVNSVGFFLIVRCVPMLKSIYLEVVWRNAKDYSTDLPFNLILCLLAVLNSSSSMFPVSLFVVLSFAIGKQFKKFTDDFSDSIHDEDFHGKIEDFRIRHQNLCILVDILDRIFSPMLAVIFSANIPMFCLVLYTMVTSIDIHISLVLINLFWLCFILLQMAIVSVTAAWVNVKAHSPLDHIYSIRFSRASGDVQLQMCMFLSRLTGTQIGITAMKLFVIDKPTMLTVAGMMVTYFVLLIQFKIPIAADCSCNITGTVYMDNSSLEVTQIA